MRRHALSLSRVIDYLHICLGTVARDIEKCRTVHVVLPKGKVGT